MVRFGVRWFGFLFVLFQAVDILRAESPELVGLANVELATRFSAFRGPNVDRVVLKPDDNEDISLINQQALKLRSARYFVYDSANESALQAMYRERLVQHGVAAIDVTPRSRRQAASQAPNQQRPLLSLLAFLKATP